MGSVQMRQRRGNRGVVAANIHGGGQVVQSAMRSNEVVDAFPLLEHGIEARGIERQVVDGIEFVQVGTMGPFDTAVEFGRVGRQDEKLQSEVTASLLELFFELAAAIDLNGPDRERHACEYRAQELLGMRRRGLRVNFQDIPTGDHIPSGEMLHPDMGKRVNVQSIDLYEIPWQADFIVPGFSHCVGTFRGLVPGQLPPGASRRELPSSEKIIQHAPDCGCG